MHVTLASSANASETYLDMHQLSKAKHSIYSATQGPVRDKADWAQNYVQLKDQDAHHTALDASTNMNVSLSPICPAPFGCFL